MSQSPLPSQGRGQGEGFCRTSNDAVNNPSPQSSPPYDGERQICPSARLSLSAVLLAGGESRRMGTDKATFVFRGKPLWQVQLETLQKLRPKEIFVSARIDPPWRREDVLFVADLPPSRGPLSGLAASMNRMSTSSSAGARDRYAVDDATNTLSFFALRWSPVAVCCQRSMIAPNHWRQFIRDRLRLKPARR